MNQDYNKFCISRKKLVFLILVLFIIIFLYLSSFVSKNKQIIQGKAKERVTKNNKNISTIIGGENAKLGEFPYVALLSNGCTGVLIHSRWVLTAAHCVDMNLSVAVGIINVNDFEKRKNKVLASISHPEYEFFSLRNDIALLLLEKEEQGIVLPKLPKIDLKKNIDDNYMYEDKTDIVSVGWGCVGISPTPGATITSSYANRNWDMVYSEILQKTTFQLVKSADISSLSDDQKNKISFGDKDGRIFDHAICYGDSGGPVLYMQGDDAYVIGLSSSGSSGLSETKSSGPKIINYLSWLNEKINAPVSVSILSSDYYNITPPDLCTNKMRCKNPSLMCKLSNKVSRGKCVPKKYLQIFLSSLVSRGNLGGLSGADNKCKQMAKNANLKGVFKAFLSNSKENVALRIKIKNLPYLTVDGYIIANNFSDLSQNKLNYPLVVNEKGQHEILDDEPFTAINVFTGTNQDLSTGSHCGDWKKDNQTIYGTYGITGFNKQKSSSWLYHTIGSCYDPYRIYCIEDEK